MGGYQYLLPAPLLILLPLLANNEFRSFVWWNFGCAFMSLMTCSCCYLFFGFDIIDCFPYGRYEFSLLSHRTPATIKTTFHYTLSFQHCVTLLIRSIFSVYTNMVMKIFSAELSSVKISIIFPSSHNFLFSLELLVFLCLFNLPCFSRTYHWFIPKILSQYKFLSIVPTYQIFQQFALLGNMSLEAALSSGLTAPVVHSYDSGIYLPYLWDSHHLPCELLNQLLDCSLSIAVERSKAFWLLILRDDSFFTLYSSTLMMSLGAGFALIPLGL